MRLFDFAVMAALVAGSMAAPPVAAASPPAAVAPPASPSPPADYARPENWLCRPGVAGPCNTDLAATAISPRGIAPAPAAPVPEAPAIDCFYVYPTVSQQSRSNSELTVTADEIYVVQQQFARFGSICRLFAPMYRQGTLAALRGKFPAGDAALAYGDVNAAWRHYLAHDNHGRGVLLIGHSQGSRWLKRLLAEEISGKPVQQQLVAAYVIGSTVNVPTGQRSGGDLGAVPLCAAPTETGCAIAYSSFRSDAPPPANSRYGRTTVPGMTVACVNPANVAGGSGALTTYLPSRPRVSATGNGVSPTGNAGAAIPTPFLLFTGLVRAECVDRGGASYLAIATDSPQLQAMFSAIDTPAPDWGLHILDVSLAMGNLVDLAAGQAAAWRKAH
ncbi:MAG: DUF3089 domain-containing protein [Polymorphobacter sp.]